MTFVLIAVVLILLLVPFSFGFYIERQRKNVLKYPEGSSFWRKELKSSGITLGGILAFVCGDKLYLYPLLDLCFNPHPIAPLIEVPVMLVGIALVGVSGWCLSWLIRK